MDAFFHVFAKILTWLFAIGAAGCIVTIPVVAWKFFSVLFEKDESEHGEELPVPPKP